MTRLHSFIIASLLSPALASAEMPLVSTAEPANEAPSNGGCGLRPNVTHQEALTEITAVYYKVVDLSGLGWDPMLYYDQDATDFSAEAVPVGHPLNMTNRPTVHFSALLCDAAHSKDELAFAFAHELAHIAHEDSAKERAFLRRRFIEWARNRPGGVSQNLFIPGLAWSQFFSENPGIFLEFQDLQRAQEAAADRAAFNTLNQPSSPYRASAGAAFMGHIQDRNWAMGFGGFDAPTHPPLAQRAADIQGGFFSKLVDEALKGR